MNEQPSFINASAISGLLFGLVISVMSIITGYMTINAEPTGSFITPFTMSSMLACLIGAFAGMVAVKLYVREHEIPLALGRGAVIGLVAGLVSVFVGTLINMIWHFMIDTSYTENLMRAIIANTEAMDAPQEMIDNLVDTYYAQFQQQYTVGGILSGLGLQGLIAGFLNIITGILGAKFFAEQPVDSLED